MKILRLTEINYDEGRFVLKRAVVDSNNHNIEHIYMRLSVVVNINFPAFVKRYIIVSVKT